MFSQNKQTQETILVIFITLVLLGLIVGLALFWINNPQKSSNQKVTGNNSNPETLFEKQRKVAKKYRTEISKQIDEINKAKSIDKIIADTQNFFLNAQVPKKYLDSHFQAFLEFKNKKSSLKDKSSKQAKQEIKKIIENITG